MIEGLNDKQRRFCEEYVIDFNSTQAAIRAGYSRKTAYSIGQRLLKKVETQNYLLKLKQKTAETNNISKDQLINELAKISFFDIRKIFTVDGGMKNVHDFDDDSAAAVAGVETFDVTTVDGMVLGTTKKVKLNNKIAAIERLSKMLGYDAPVKTEGSLSITWNEEKTYEADT